MDYLVVYAEGIVSMSVCAPASWTPERIAAEANRIRPTGIRSPWLFSADKTFAGGEPVPSPCETDQTRIHYLLEC